MDLKVLVVDDDEIFLLLHDCNVTDSGLAPSTLGFEEATKALEYLDAEHNADDYYLILLDINMPVMNGWQFLDAVEQRPYSDQIFVIIVTSSIDYEDRIKAQGYSHVIDYIEKPLNIETCERIRQISLINDIINS